MVLVDPDELGSDDVARIYIAGRIPEAREVERVLSENGVDYFVEIEPFRKLLLGFLPTEYKGVAFYVTAPNAELSVRVLHEAGLIEGLVAED
jgi:hypothetical protein